jgi:hypothetical protein
MTHPTITSFMLAEVLLQNGSCHQLVHFYVRESWTEWGMHAGRSLMLVCSHSTLTCMPGAHHPCLMGTAARSLTGA